MHHIHESPFVMMLPLCILAIGAIFAGVVGYNIGMVDPGGGFWKGSVFVLEQNNNLEAAHHVPQIIKLLPSIVGLLGISLAYLLYMFIPTLPGMIASTFSQVYNFLLNKWYFDELYEFLFVRPVKSIGNVLWRVGDVVVIDGMGPNGAAWLSQRCASALSGMQSGFVYTYALVMLLGMIGLIGWFLI
jgi:NADH-quinone oxidoreductase subunit L